MQNIGKKTIILLVGAVIILFATAQWFAVRQQSLLTGHNYNPETNVIYDQKNTVMYVGRTGTDALTLLREKTTVKQDGSGMVTMINGRDAKQSGREFWAFYVNGKLASVGPAEYQTKNGDRIEWKIEKY